jgi:hypothetical protein
MRRDQIRIKVRREKVREKVRCFCKTLKMNEIDTTWCELLHPPPIIRGYGGATFADRLLKAFKNRVESKLDVRDRIFAMREHED